ncbi:unnamed protein product [Pieris macdunnoughi]|uniref:Uncharacterized protein n=1 Tax=Pieris macdunnoughi TaxID=345717 RepID=A0A821MNU0_9NEOP|nr:unnamed protein product [Pieris macdunnoughi]
MRPNRPRVLRLAFAPNCPQPRASYNLNLPILVMELENNDNMLPPDRIAECRSYDCSNAFSLEHNAPGSSGEVSHPVLTGLALTRLQLANCTAVIASQLSCKRLLMLFQLYSEREHGLSKKPLRTKLKNKIEIDPKLFLRNGHITIMRSEHRHPAVV